jgi:predicted MPP superfamily phosphohydrolase
MALYTNRGLGTVALPLRFCARPEITIFTLKST